MDITVYLSKFLSTLSLRRATAIVLMRAATQRIFLSTLSLRRATAPAQRSTLKESDFYPRSPCGERLFHFNHTILIQCISIHALLAESDAMARGCNYKPPPFLSTLSLRRATVRPRCRGCPAAYFYPRSPCGERPLVHQLRGLADVSISIHALLAESDRMTWILLYICQNFYPRSPCGERRQ